MKVHFYLRYHTSYGQNLFIQSNDLDLKNGEALMEYVNDAFWRYSCEVKFAEGATINYRFAMRQLGKMDNETHGFYTISKPKKGISELTIIDTWNGTEQVKNVFTTQAFQKLLSHPKAAVQLDKLTSGTHVFRIKAPLLKAHQVPVLVGSSTALHNWSQTEPVTMQYVDGQWVAEVNLNETEFPVAYKYALYDTEKGTIERFEDGTNRTLFALPRTGVLHIINDGFLQVPNEPWRGAGVAIPVFSLRSKQSFGCGAFTDLIRLADWASSVGLKMIQLLPINDTSATGTWTDSYPYASISAFALNPIYIDPKAIAGKKHAALIKPMYDAYQAQLADLHVVDYEITLRQKWLMLSALFAAIGDSTLKSEQFKAYFEEQKHWLVPYAAFCHLRDVNGTTDFNQWPQYSKYDINEISALTNSESKAYKAICLHYFVQFYLHQQLKEATLYANKKGLVVKGDIPIGIYRYSCDAWVAPELYNMDRQAGAPPDDFSVTGQNWGFPTYRWAQMKTDGFAWWRSRFDQMSLYFDAFRIDHILGFFRIWSIPLDAVQGILGHFDPAIPLIERDFHAVGISFDRDRFCEPLINVPVLNALFGNEAIQAAALFLDQHPDGWYRIKQRYQTQKDIEAWYAETEKSSIAANLRDGMYDLIANILLFEVDADNGKAYHFRFGIEKTLSFKYLDAHTQNQLRYLYNDYFYSRQDAFWQKEAMEKLPALKQSTNMLICGEDLGMVPHCVPDVMHQLALLSLEIQRMPKATGTMFFDPKDAPYLSVVTPSTHDMSTVRGWWEEDPQLTQKFYQTLFRTQESAPFYCEPWINRAIVEQHLASPAMWSIFQLQDLMGIDQNLRWTNPHDERINLPSDPKHYWRYRMHLTLEQLMLEKDFNQALAGLVHAYGRSE
jgi:4-alpha-glucanotransferase